MWILQKKFKVRDRTNHIFFCQNKFIEQRLNEPKRKKITLNDIDNKKNNSEEDSENDFINNIDMNLNQTEKKYENNKSYMLTESYNNINPITLKNLVKNQIYNNRNKSHNKLNKTMYNGNLQNNNLVKKSIFLPTIPIKDTNDLSLTKKKKFFPSNNTPKINFAKIIKEKKMKLKKKIPKK